MHGTNAARNRINLRPVSFCVILISISLCYSQGRQNPPRTVVSQNAPFLQQAKAYEETQYVTKIVLKNGMKVIVNEFKRQPVVSIQAYVRAGFLDEPAGSPGIAPLLASMIHRGTGDKSIGSYRQNVQALGGFFGSFTDHASTQFEVVVPAAQWKRALAMQSDALLNPVLESDALKLEANLLRDEARGLVSEPSVYAGEKLFELGFDQPRMARASALAANPLPGIAREALAEYHKSRYTADALTLVISGDISSGDVLNEVVRLYGKASGAATPRERMSLPGDQKEFRYRAVRGSVGNPRILFGFHTVSIKSEDYWPVEVLRAIIGSGEGSVLNSRLRDQKKIIVAEETILMTLADSGYVSVEVEVSPQNVDRAEIGVLTEIELLKREEPDELEMERALAQLEQSYWKSIETVSGRAQMLAHFESLGDWKTMDRYVSDLRKVKSSDVKRVANRYLQLQNCSLLEYLPASGEDRNLTVESMRGTLEPLLKPSTDQEEAERAKEVVLAVKLPSESGGFKFSEIQYPFQMASILRGPDIYIREDHTSPMIDIGIFFAGGKLQEKTENAGITNLMVNLMLQGTKEMMTAQFNRQIEIYGGQVRPVVADDYFGFFFSILSKNIAASFDLLQQAIRAPDLSREAVNRQKDVLSGKIPLLKDSAAYPAARMHQALFKETSYAIDRMGSEASVAGISPNAVQAWYDTFVKNRKPVVIAVGDTSGTALAAYFVKHFSGSRMQETKIQEEYTRPLEKGLSIEETWNRGESLILFGFQAPPEDDEDGYATRVLQSYAGEMGRFSQEIRDRLGIAYKVGVVYEPRLRGGSIIASAAADPKNEEAVVTAFREEIKRLTDNPVAYRDFRSAVNQAVGAHAIRTQVRSMQIRDLADNLLAGKGKEGYYALTNGIQEVSEEDLKGITRRIFNMDKGVILRVHGRAR